MRSLLLFAVLSAPATAAPVPKELTKKDVLYGTWSFEKVVIDGRTVVESGGGMFWVIDRNNDLSFQLTSPDDTPPPIAKPALPNGWAVTTDAAKREMKFDPIRKEFDHTGGESPRLGRYELRSETLTVCLGFPGSPRPASVNDLEKTQIWTLKRVIK